MTKDIIVNVGERETRIAVVEDGKLVEMHVERAERVVGSLYKCRVANVVQGMDAAFVDVGLERNAYLSVADVLPSDIMGGSGSEAAPVALAAPAGETERRNVAAPVETERRTPNDRRPRFERGRRRNEDAAGVPSRVPADSAPQNTELAATTAETLSQSSLPESGNVTIVEAPEIVAELPGATVSQASAERLEPGSDGAAESSDTANTTAFADTATAETPNETTAMPELPHTVQDGESPGGNDTAQSLNGTPAALSVESDMDSSATAEAGEVTAQATAETPDTGIAGAEDGATLSFAPTTDTADAGTTHADEAANVGADAVLAADESAISEQQEADAADNGAALTASGDGEQAESFAPFAVTPKADTPRIAIEAFLALPTLVESEPEAVLTSEQAASVEAVTGMEAADLVVAEAGERQAEVETLSLVSETDHDNDEDDAETDADSETYLDDELDDTDEDDESALEYETDEAGEAESGTESTARSGRPGANRPPRNPNFRRSMLRQQRIRDVIKVGQELLVQVIKGPRSTKGARVSTRVSLPGRYLVLMPEADNLGVSRKVEDAKERDRLKKIGDRIREPGFGLIIRTEAEDKTEAELRADMDFLLQSWRQVLEKSRQVSAPALIQQDLTLLYQTIRDVFGSDVNKLVIDDPAEYEKANELLDRLSPKLKGRIHLYDGAKAIFDEYGLEQEMDRLLRRKVFLKSGGSLVIDETEALTVIDVNTSKFTGGSSLAETIIKTNLDAAVEIARQLRLRDIGGIIVIDFIDMNNQRDKQAVLKALEMALKRDRSRTKISNISPLGLVEMTRKRTGETLTGFMTDECPYCKGRGHLPSAESVSIALERELRRAINTAQNAKRDAFIVTCHPEVAELLVGPEGATIEDLERQMERAIFVRADDDAHVEKFAIEGADLNDVERSRMPFKRAQIIDCRISRSLLKEPNRVIGWADGYLLDLDDGARYLGQSVKVRLTDVRRSYAAATVLPGTNKPA